MMNKALIKSACAREVGWAHLRHPSDTCQEFRQCASWAISLDTLWMVFEENIEEFEQNLHFIG